MKDPLEMFEANDAVFYEAIGKNRDMAFSDGALSGKTKLLIGLAIDAVKSAENGVRSLAVAAMESGATKEEILETLRVAYFIGGAGAAYTAANALGELFEK